LSTPAKARVRYLDRLPLEQLRGRVMRGTATGIFERLRYAPPASSIPNARY
jgi:hypothetical protein